MVDSSKIEKPTTFDELFAIAKNFTLEYNRDWSDGKGFHPYAIHGMKAPSLKEGAVMSCITPGNRRMVFVGTRYGNVLFYERYCEEERRKKQDNIKNSITINCTHSSENILNVRSETILTQDEFVRTLKKLWIDLCQS